MLKRILALCLIFLLSASVCTIMPAFAASDSDMNLLQDLGIIDLTEKTGFFAKGFTRADFATTMCAALFEDENLTWFVEEGVRYAEDIDNNKNFNAIVTMLKLGYMKTNSSGYFRPSADITYQEAVYAFVSALGYKSLAQEKGGTDGDYLAVASKIGLLRRVSITDTEKLTAQEVGAMLANAMGITVLEDSITNVNGQCLWDKLEIVKSQGKILANQNFGLVVDKAPKNHINIDGKEYKTNLYVKDEAVGSEVTFYTKKGNFGSEVISIFYHANEETVTLDSGDIDVVESNGGVITVTDNKGKEINFSKSGYAVVNSKTVTPDISLFRALKSGMVTFVDSDGNGVYDIAHMTILKQGIVEAINYDNEAFSTRYDNATVTLEDIDYQVYVDDEAVEFDSLTRGMVVGIACDSWSLSEGRIIFDYSQAKNIKLYASATTAEGVVSSYTDISVKLGDMMLAFSDAYQDFVARGKISPIRLGDYIVAYQDLFGEIVYYEIDVDNSTMQYGYLIAAGVDSGAFDNKNQFKIMNTNGEVELLGTDTTFVLDEEKVAAGSLTYSVGARTVDFSKRQLVRYEAKDSILKKLDTKAVRPGKEDEQSSLYEVMSFDPYADGQPSRSIENSVIDYSFGFKQDVIVFYDEAPLTGINPSPNRFSVTKPKDVSSGTYYIAGYNANDTGLLSVAVIYNSYGRTGDSFQSKFGYFGHNGHMISEISRSVNQEGTLGWTLVLAGDSGMTEYFIDPDILSLNVTDPEDQWGAYKVQITPCDADQLDSVLGVGDVIRFGKNTAGEIDYLERIFDFSVQGAGGRPIARPQLSEQTYGFVKVEKTDGDYIVYTEGTTDKRLVKQRTIYSAYPVYNTNTGKTTMVPSTEIPSAATGVDVRMFSRFYNGTPLEHMFYVFE